MQKIKIVGGKPLIGSVIVSGAKNAALPLMAASLLTEEKITLKNVPELADIKTMDDLLSDLGVKITKTENTDKNCYSKTIYHFCTDKIKSTTASYDIVKKMRASIIVLGPLLARFGYAKVSMPGGCAIGTRPIDIHLDALKEMGAKIKLNDGYVEAKVSGKLQAKNITFSFPSVGATENIVMAACLAEGKSTIMNAACEPEISDLCNMLNKMGAKISGIGTNKLTITGVSKLNSCEYYVIADRIEAGTYAIAAHITGGKIEIKNINPEIIENVLQKLAESGAEIELNKNSFTVKSTGKIKPISVETEVYPNFPTDMQAQWVALMCLADGKSIIKENIFENRFMHAAELARMGANIKQHHDILEIEGKEFLKPAKVMATDLRASVSLILAALATKGETTVERIYHLDRGYENIEKKIQSCGGNITRIEDA